MLLQTAAITPIEVLVKLWEGATLEQIGDGVGITRERVRQIGSQHPAYPGVLLSGRRARLRHMCCECGEPVQSNKLDMCDTCRAKPRFCKCGCGEAIDWFKSWASKPCMQRWKWRHDADYRHKQMARMAKWAAANPTKKRALDLAATKRWQARNPDKALESLRQRYYRNKALRISAGLQ